ncbi:Streptothricin hydrolase [BD1-7 clade bacterium]|uniref:Streptothricin hydrolase n=1 Tax=BD1-7 clade bacterium TaxID=2029982 RepID=A0A5S9PX23_9GAMM|nr:Streptothricin hydrolase [BD1-7 clade bacterium]CAA0113104.1 Streptothricin hydrolase [BD1-7 clade bacterium]
MTQALLIIDLQNDYYPGGEWELHNIALASANAKRILASYRAQKRAVFHVYHEFESADAPFFKPGSPGVEIHSDVAPIEGEAVVMKRKVNAFIDTDLHQQLQANNISELVIIGAMSHMCIDAATRAASDLGYQVTVAEDACASREVTFGDASVSAEDTHNAYMSSLSFAYANVITTEALLAD